MSECRYKFKRALFFAIPNGDYRSHTAGARLKREGVVPGIPDLCFPIPRHGYHGMWIELKQPGNYPTPEQQTLLLSLREEGYYTFWCDAVEDAFALVKLYLTADKVTLIAEEHAQIERARNVSKGPR